MSNFTAITSKLIAECSLSKNELITLLNPCSESEAEYLRQAAQKTCTEIYGKKIYLRGLVEFTNYCKNNCYYCGIRLDNAKASRYRMSKEEIINACDNAYKQGFRTFVLQGGEDAYFNNERLCEIIAEIKSMHPNCALTLSIGEKSKESYKMLKKAGADRYLLRHETANKAHYKRLHPENASYERRIQCLKDLKEAGFQVGCGFMVGSPFQTLENIAEDLMLIKELKPEMVGIGPFIPHHQTPFAHFKAGSAILTFKLLSILRLLLPSLLLPATTALGTLNENNRIKGILAGANVFMPNITPPKYRGKYSLYNEKAAFGAEAAEGLELFENELSKIGYKTVIDRGDPIYKERNKLNVQPKIS